MTKTQISQLRAAINTAHACGDLAQAEKLQAKLHDHFMKEAEEFIASAEGVRHMDDLVNKFD